MSRKKMKNSEKMEYLFYFKKQIISEQTIKLIITSLKDISPAVRETAASSIGIIGYPEAFVALNNLIQAINDIDVNVKTNAIWAIGKFAQYCDLSVLNIIIDNLNKSNVWKVKMACLITITNFGDKFAKYSLPILKKLLLKDSTVNKQIVCEVMVIYFL